MFFDYLRFRHVLSLPYLPLFQFVTLVYQPQNNTSLGWFKWFISAALYLPVQAPAKAITIVILVIHHRKGQVDTPVIS